MIIKQNIALDFAHEQRRLHIWLPDDYDAPGSQERYAVMYMWDGQNMFQDQDATYGKSWGMAAYLSHWWKHMIVVGMQCANNSPQRLNEYSPYAVRIEGSPLLHGDAELTMQWLITVVKPWVDAHFRTCPIREATGVGGSSMGGMISLYAILKHNDVFSKAACLSPSIRSAMPHFMREIDEAHLAADTRVYLSWGTDEWRTKTWEPTMRRNIRRLQAAIVHKQPQCRTMCYRQEGGGHNEASWERQLPLFLPFLWEG